MKVAVGDKLYFSKNGHHPTVLYADKPTVLYAKLEAISLCEPCDCILLHVVVSTLHGAGELKLRRESLRNRFAIDKDDFLMFAGCDIVEIVKKYEDILKG